MAPNPTHVRLTPNANLPPHHHQQPPPPLPRSRLRPPNPPPPRLPNKLHLYRNILPQLAKTHRAIALDLPGYGLSDKPLDVRYDYDFYADVLDSFLDALGILIAMKTPGLRDFLLSPKGLVGAMQFGVANNSPPGRFARQSMLDKCSVYRL